MTKGGAVLIICEICGKPIKVRPCEIDTRRFCSRKCMGIHQSENCVGKDAYHWKGGMVTLRCLECNRAFEVKVNEVKKRKHCSQKCYSIYLSKNNIGEDNPHFGMEHSAKTKRKMSIIVKKRYENKSNHPRWKGGKSFEPYCVKFNEMFKEDVRSKFNRLCFICKKTEAENGRRLDVHHVNYDKSCLCNDIDCEFVPLCMSCHSKTNSNRPMWERHILDKLGALN